MQFQEFLQGCYLWRHHRINVHFDHQIFVTPANLLHFAQVGLFVEEEDFNDE